jgi:hypothetical protein
VRAQTWGVTKQPSHSFLVPEAVGSQPLALLSFWTLAACSLLNQSLLHLQVVLLPALAGLALGEAFPNAVATLRPLCALSAVGLVTLTCASNVAHSAHVVLHAGPRLLAAVLALHAGGRPPLPRL